MNEITQMDMDYVLQSKIREVEAKLKSNYVTWSIVYYFTIHILTYIKNV